MGSMRQCFFSRFSCPFCDYVAGRVSKAHKDLDLETDIIQANVGYSIHSHVMESDRYEGVKMCRTGIIKLKGRDPSDFNVMSFALASAYFLASPRKSHTCLIRRPLAASLETEQLQEWIQACDRTHACCKAPANESALLQRRLEELQLRGRFRLIDVQTREIFQTDAEQHQLPKYFALSYVWGKAMHRYSADTFRKTRPATSSGVSEMMVNFPENFASTVEDAILLVKNLGGRYLWVDLYCINQEDADEKMDVISQMGTIYQNAYATLVAATGDGADAGLPPLHQNSTRTEIPAKFEVDGRTVELLEPRPGLKKLLQRTTWNSRAWTYQEFRLSRRCILIFDSEVAFTCLEGSQREAYVMHYSGNKNRSKASARSKPLLEHPKLENWYYLVRYYKNIVKDYSKRNLTNNTDKLNAFMGVYDMITRGTVSPVAKQALCGLPPKDFLAALLWHVSDHHPLPSRIVPQDEGMRRLPTWCWAAWSSPIEYLSNARRKQYFEEEALMLLIIVENSGREPPWTVEVLDEANLTLSKRQSNAGSEEHWWSQK